MLKEHFKIKIMSEIIGIGTDVVEIDRVISYVKRIVFLINIIQRQNEK